MSALPERRQPIDIEEFERRLRAPEASKSENDPLAELARLVSGQSKAGNDPFASLFDERRPAAAPIAETRAVELRGGFDDASHNNDAPSRMSESHTPVNLDIAPSQSYPTSNYDDWSEPELVVDYAPPPAKRSRRLLYITGGVLASGFVAIASTLVWQGGGSSTKSEIPSIKAATGPVKVMPQNTETAEAPGRDATILDKSAKTPVVKQVVSREEQPIDVGQSAKSPRMIPMSEGATTTAITGATTQGSVAAVASPVSPPRADPASHSVFPEPKKVKTVAVRADGSIISSETNNAPNVAPPQPPARANGNPAASASKNATPKSNVRAATTPKGEAETALPKPKPVATASLPKPVKPAAQRDAEDDSDDTATATAPASGGGYVVQLAAPGSESEARQVAQRLGEKYSSAFGGRRPSVQKASDKSVYRVRVGGLSRDSANDACDRVKAAGGACFVAKN